MRAGGRAKLVVTSPPYGVGKSYEKKGIEQWHKTVSAAIKNICAVTEVVVWNIVDLYSTGSQFIEPTFAYSIGMFAKYGMRPIWIRIWLKQGMNFGVRPYHLVSNKPVQQYEYVAAFGGDGCAIPDDQEEIPDMTSYEWILAFSGSKYRFVKRLSKSDRREWGYAGVWRMNTIRANNEHPAMFPVMLASRAIKMHSDEGDVVLDPFIGSGTTMIACENLGRQCRALEISPAYCAVALERMENAFGIVGERV
jgi:DNA modification methylase